jgi:hypothetical protein
MTTPKTSGPQYDNIFSMISFGNLFIDIGSPAVTVGLDTAPTLLRFDSMADVICT